MLKEIVCEGKKVYHWYSLASGRYGPDFKSKKDVHVWLKKFTEGF
jgi:hypothetical protein